MEPFALVGVLRGALALVFSGVLVWLGLGVSGAVGGFLAAALVALVSSLWLLARSLPSGTLAQAPEPQTRTLLRFSLPLYIAGFSYLLMTRTDIIMLGYFAQPEQVGAYRAAVALARLVVFGLTAIDTAFAPMIAGLYHRGDYDELREMYRTGTRWGVLLSLLAAMPFLLYPKEVLGMYGPGFVVAAWALVALVSFQLINAGVGSVGFMLQMSGYQDWVLGNNLFTAALNIGLNLWWIPRWGILGAALATGTSLALNNILGMICSAGLDGYCDSGGILFDALAGLGVDVVVAPDGGGYHNRFFELKLQPGRSGGAASRVETGQEVEGWLRIPVCRTSSFWVKPSVVQRRFFTTTNR